MSNSIIRFAVTVTIMITLSSCQYEQLNRSEFMSDSAGNSMAHNSALQVVDPWPRSAGNNNLKVPTGEYGGEPKEGEAAPAPIIIQTTGGQQ